MRHIRGLQILSLVVLSPLIICLLALLSILALPIYSVLKPTLSRLVPTKTILCFFVLFLVITLFKTKRTIKIKEPLEFYDQPITEKPTKKQLKKRKPKKNKQYKKKDKHTKQQVKDNKMTQPEQDMDEEEQDMEEEQIDEHMDEEDVNYAPVTPLQNSPEQSDNEMTVKKNNNWYSPFSTGLDLDILPKFTMDQYKIHSTKNTCTSPLIPNILYHHPHPHLSSPPSPPLSHHHHSKIELLENHPFISTSSNHHHHYNNHWGPIGENKSKSSLTLK
ncbi:hypothetical protein RMCBS344292_06899 [Rhizopus microsporus]|nr:hypothetical protein RMCBS344292_06899 [Rhizopus microsporus]